MCDIVLAAGLTPSSLMTYPRAYRAAIVEGQTSQSDLTPYTEREKSSEPHTPSRHPAIKSSSAAYE